MKRKICVVTGSRAEYGLLKPLLDDIKRDRDLELLLMATGTHLSHEFGLTYKEIERDGFVINEKIEIVLSSDTACSISKSMGIAMINFAEAYERLKPDIVVALGDRYEIFSVVAAALIAKIPVAHINGGEITEGSLDDALRHSITKMSHLHFASTEEYRKRIIQLGEDPERVFNVGALAIDNIKKLKPMPRKNLEKELNFKLNKYNLLVTFHPATLEKNTSRGQFQNLLHVLDELKNTNIIFTKANADIDGRIINELFDKYTSKNPHKAIGFASMGQMRYLSTMKLVDTVIGNSSSGITEAPSFKIGTINIGDRQKGRIKAESIIDCAPTKQDIRRAIKRLYSRGFQDSLKRVVNPYGDGNSAKRIKTILKKCKIKNLKKRFYDLSFEYKKIADNLYGGILSGKNIEKLSNKI